MKKINNQSGFTLIELAVVILISGTLMAGAISLAKPYVMQTQVNSTNKRMEAISSALSTFALNYGRLPCPADSRGISEPFGSPRGSGTTGTDIAKSDCTGGAFGTQSSYVGIVPFRALGLDEDQSQDGFGNYFTYAVTPAMTQFNATPPVDATSDMNIESECKSATWKQDGKNKNIYKAHLCCPTIPPGPAISLLDAKGALPVHSIFIGDAGANNNNNGGVPLPEGWKTYEQAYNDKTYNDESPTTAGAVDNGGGYNYSTTNYDYRTCQSFTWNDAACGYEGPGSQSCILADSQRTERDNYLQGKNMGGAEPWEVAAGSYGETYCDERLYKGVGSPPGGNGVPNPYTSKSFVAYVLVSHGKNGDGAYMKGSLQKQPITVDVNAEESENRNDDLTFVNEPISTNSDTHYFDDILLFKTNDQLVTKYLNNSCVLP